MKSKTSAYLLWFFLGWLGIHKFYLDKVLVGIIYIFTFGIFGIGWFIDLFTLGTQVDTYNALLRQIRTGNINNMNNIVVNVPGSVNATQSVTDQLHKPAELTTNLTPWEIETRKAINKKVFYQYCLIAIIGLIILIGTGVVTSSDDNKTKDRTQTTQVQKEATEPKSEIIPGLAPVDVYLNMEKRGFTTEKTFSSEYGNNWDCKSQVEGIDFRVSVYSTDVDNVESVKATAMIDPSIKDIISTQPFMVFVASLPFDNSRPEETMNWVKENFNNNKATKIVGEVKFTIYAPTKMLRMLTIERNFQ